MTLRIVTDSTADLPPDLAHQLGITVVPAYLRFGKDVYRDRVDMSEEEFYQRLQRDPIHPSTEPPTPKDFADVYLRLSQEADGIISIHISGKLSATCNSARRAAEMLEERCPVEVVDSQSVTMGVGLLAIATADAIRPGRSLKEVAEEAKQNVLAIRMLGVFDTLKYLARGGRIGKAKALLGKVLSVKPILTMRDGEIEPGGQVRNRSSGIDRLADFVSNVGAVREVAIVHSTTPDEARTLAERITARLGTGQVRLARLGPALGVHGGPGVLLVALRLKN